MLIQRFRAIALEVGLDPTEALQMHFVDFARHVAGVRACRVALRLSLAVIARPRLKLLSGGAS
jgi:hypothetical protein